jgi:hypothetical protein
LIRSHFVLSFPQQKSKHKKAKPESISTEDASESEEHELNTSMSELSMSEIADQKVSTPDAMKRRAGFTTPEKRGYVSPLTSFSQLPGIHAPTSAPATPISANPENMKETPPNHSFVYLRTPNYAQRSIYFCEFEDAVTLLVINKNTVREFPLLFFVCFVSFLFFFELTELSSPSKKKKQKEAVEEKEQLMLIKEVKKMLKNYIEYLIIKGEHLSILSYPFV